VVRVESVQRLVVKAFNGARREGALEEAADPAGAVPARGDAYQGTSASASAVRQKLMNGSWQKWRRQRPRQPRLAKATEPTFLSSSRVHSHPSPTMVSFVEEFPRASVVEMWQACGHPELYAARPCSRCREACSEWRRDWEDM
jgi:hypothetical protein